MGSERAAIVLTVDGDGRWANLDVWGIYAPQEFM
jgi:hypothetical protein